MGRRNKVLIYSIILANHGKQLSVLYSARTEQKIYTKFHELLEKNKSVMFPINYNNEKHHMVNADYEIIIIKCKDENDKDTTVIRNEYGKFINYTSSDEDWIIIDRATYYIEETFWVYGYHPRLQRKTFDWVFNEYILSDANNKNAFKTILVYNNKLLIDCNGNLNMVICKNKSDAIRFYNLIEKEALEKRIKYLLFIGDIRKSQFKLDWMKRIQDLTHWSWTKIKRLSTRP